MLTLKNNMQTVRFAWGVSLINLILFHLPFFRFVFRNLDYVSINGMIIVLSLLILILVLNFFVFYILFSLSHTVGKFLLTLFFILNALSLYFVNTYSVIIDEINRSRHLYRSYITPNNRQYMNDVSRSRVLVIGGT